jgi:hypothetical protein
MIPKWDQRRRYESKARIQLYRLIVVKQGKKAVNGQFMGQPGGQEFRQITARITAKIYHKLTGSLYKSAYAVTTEAKSH